MVNTASEGTVNVKLPSKSEIVPLVVPFWTTLAPITVCPVASFTTPFTVMFCPNAHNGTIQSKNNSFKDLKQFSLFIILMY